MSKKLLAKIRVTDTTLDKVPAGWRTISQWAALWGLQHSQASRYIRRALASGLVERRVFRIATGARSYPVPHYRETRAGRASQ